MLLTKFSLDALNQSSPSTSAEQTTCQDLGNTRDILDGCVDPESFQAAFELGLAADDSLPASLMIPWRVRTLVLLPTVLGRLCPAPSRLQATWEPELDRSSLTRPLLLHSLGNIDRLIPYQVTEPEPDTGVPS